MKIKVNDKWYSVKSIAYYADNKTDLVDVAAPEEVEDIKPDSDSGCSYKDLEQMHVEYNCPESDVQAAMNDYDATIAPLVERVGRLEELMRQIILALDIYKNDKDVLASRDMECLQERVNTLEELNGNQVADASKIDWEQRRYEIAKHIAGAIYAHSTDIPDVEANYIVELTDNVIKQLKSKANDNRRKISRNC
jgi:hypothetical protein